jgi:shikimate kinase
LFLIGYRGTGKTSVARPLALRLGWDWVDADVEIELRAGKSIASIFADDGEPAFRDLEAQVLADLAKRDKLVVACGGGVVLRPENRDILKRGGQVVWLQAAVETIVERLAADVSTSARRPSLTRLGQADEVRHLLEEREPLYRECADVAIVTQGRDPSEIAEIIVQKLNLGRRP